MYSPKLRETPGRDAAPGFFVAWARVRPRRARFSCLQKKQGNTGDHTVSSLLFTGNGATAACEIKQRGRLAGPRRAFAYGARYSAMVRTTLEVGRVSPGAP